MIKKLLIATFMVIMSYQAKSEYRVYEYIVKSKFPITGDESAYTVTSTLDPVSYVAYHGGKSTIEADLLRTWMCKGNTAGRAPCSSPYSATLNEDEVETLETP